MCLCFQTHFLSKGGSEQRTRGGHKSTQHCRSQGSAPVEENNLKGWRLLYSPPSFNWHQESRQSIEQSCKRLHAQVKMRRVLPAKHVLMAPKSVVWHAVHNRTPEHKSLASFRCFFIRLVRKSPTASPWHHKLLVKYFVRNWEKLNEFFLHTIYYHIR